MDSNHRRQNRQIYSQRRTPSLAIARCCELGQCLRQASCHCWHFGTVATNWQPRTVTHTAPSGDPALGELHPGRVGVRSTKAGGVPPATRSTVRHSSTRCRALNEGRRRTSGDPSMPLSRWMQVAPSLNEGRRRTSGDPGGVQGAEDGVHARSTKAGGVPPATPRRSAGIRVSCGPLNEGRRRTSGDPEPWWVVADGF